MVPGPGAATGKERRLSWYARQQSTGLALLAGKLHLCATGWGCLHACMAYLNQGCANALVPGGGWGLLWARMYVGFVDMGMHGVLTGLGVNGRVNTGCGFRRCMHAKG